MKKKVSSYIHQCSETFYLKFLNTLFKKYNPLHCTTISYAELRQILSALYSLNKCEAKLFLKSFSEKYEFVTLNRRGLVISKDKIKWH